MTWIRDNIIALAALALSSYSLFRVVLLDRARRERDQGRRAARAELSRLVREGDRVVSRATYAIQTAGDPDTYGPLKPNEEAFGKATDLHQRWTREVAQYLRGTPVLGPEYEHRFGAQVTNTAIPAQINVEALDMIVAIVRARQERLRTFIAELRADNGPTT